MPFGVNRLLYSGRTAKAYAAEVNAEFGKKNRETYTVKGDARGRCDNPIQFLNYDINKDVW